MTHIAKLSGRLDIWDVLLGVGRRILLGVGRRVLLGVDERERVDRRAREEGVPAVQCRRVGRLGGE